MVLLLSQAWIEQGGTALVAALVFIETGFLLGLVVPGGETLLFTAGLLCGTQSLSTPVALLATILVAAAFLGDLTGFYIGHRIAQKLETQKDNWLFKRSEWEQARHFYCQHPHRSLIMGRFLPIVRTFNPLIAAGANMPLLRFAGLSLLGCLLYISTVVLAGYWLGQLFPKLGDYIEWIFLGVVVIVIGSLVWKRVKGNKGGNKHVS